jgi:hypothetical protein
MRKQVPNQDLGFEGNPIKALKAKKPRYLQENELSSILN